MILNTRADLDTLKGTPAYADAMKRLNASMTTRTDIAVYPNGYNTPGYTGPAVAPNWQNVETLDTITRFGFTKTEFLSVFATI